MFDLDQHIRHWREQFVADRSFHSDEVEELESHLRDGIDRLMADGLSEAEAFQVATQRLGDRETLRRAYSKNRTLAERWFPYARALALLAFSAHMAILVLTRLFGVTIPIYGINGGYGVLVLVALAMTLLLTVSSAVLMGVMQFPSRKQSLLVAALVILILVFFFSIPFLSIELRGGMHPAILAVPRPLSQTAIVVLLISFFSRTRGLRIRAWLAAAVVFGGLYAPALWEAVVWRWGIGITAWAILHSLSDAALGLLLAYGISASRERLAFRTA